MGSLPPSTKTSPETVPVSGTGTPTLTVLAARPLPPPKLHPATNQQTTTPSKTLRHIVLGRYTSRRSSTIVARDLRA